MFERSERATREWVGAGLDLDIELLQLVRRTHSASRASAATCGSCARFPGPVVADMFCLLRLELELSVQAKAMLMAREAGLDLAGRRRSARQPRGARTCEQSIGPTGLLALKPLQVTSIATTGTATCCARPLAPDPPAGCAAHRPVMYWECPRRP